MYQIKVECKTKGCWPVGRVQVVYAQLVAMDVVAVPDLRCARCGSVVRQVETPWRKPRTEKQEAVPMLRICDGCTTAYSVGAQACPECGSTDHHEQGTVAVVGEKGPELLPAPDGTPVLPVADAPEPSAGEGDGK